MRNTAAIDGIAIETGEMRKQREIWVDNVKVIACILVALGHFSQSMANSGILPKNDLYQWFNHAIHTFHVPLFFICSGYLYQKRSKVDDIHSWGRNIRKKALNLGVPYFAFTFVTWLLKSVFSNSINHQIGGLFETLFLYPTPPYWYLYALFFIFLLTPTFQNKKMAGIGLAVATALKALVLFKGEYGVKAVSYVMSNEIWFVFGMCLSVWELERLIEKTKKAMPIIAGCVFLMLSVLLYRKDGYMNAVGFVLGMLACYSIIVLMIVIFKDRGQNPFFRVIAKYTMPIFLMHILFAAPLRIILLKLGIQNAVVHVVLGVGISFLGPMAAAFVMSKTKWLEFFLYPGKVIKIR